MDRPINPNRGVDANASPNWAAIPHEVPCPLCDYNLRGLTVPRCPECGYHFDWPEVLDARRAPHAYLFEHHPESNTWSYFRTLVGSWRPRRFWSSLHPAQPSRPLRLLFYWCLGLACLPIPWAALTVYPFRVRASYNVLRRGRAVSRIQQNHRFRQQVIARYGSVQAYVNQVYPYRSTWALVRQQINRGGRDR